MGEKNVKEREKKPNLKIRCISQTKAILSTVTAPSTATILLGEDEKSEDKKLPPIPSS